MPGQHASLSGFCPLWPAQVFSRGKTRAEEEMRQACFDYLAMGGGYASGPVSLLSGKLLGSCSC